MFAAERGGCVSSRQGEYAQRPWALDFRSLPALASWAAACGKNLLAAMGGGISLLAG